MADIEILSPIDAYRAQWQPDEARIAELRAEHKRALDAGRFQDALCLLDLLLAEMRPPRNLPIKRLDVVSYE